MSMRKFLRVTARCGAVLLAAWSGMAVSAHGNQETATPEKSTMPVAHASVDTLQHEFLKLKFGMFIHYNMATYHGVQWTKGYPD